MQWQLTLVKWSSLYLFVLIDPVCLPCNSLCTWVADIVVDIECFNITTPCFTLLLKLHCLLCYILVVLQPGHVSHFLNAVFECCSLSFCPHSCLLCCITWSQPLFKVTLTWVFSYFCRYLQRCVYSSTVWLRRQWSQYLGWCISRQQINTADYCCCPVGYYVVLQTGLTTLTVGFQLEFSMLDYKYHRLVQFHIAHMACCFVIFHVGLTDTFQWNKLEA